MTTSSVLCCNLLERRAPYHVAQCAEHCKASKQLDQDVGAGNDQTVYWHICTVRRIRSVCSHDALRQAEGEDCLPCMSPVCSCNLMRTLQRATQHALSRVTNESTFNDCRSIHVRTWHTMTACHCLHVAQRREAQIALTAQQRRREQCKQYRTCSI